jgi:peptide/nickel transport system permease protein
LYGARYSLLIGVVSVIVGLSIGIVVGAIAGYSGGWIDSVLMRLMDIMLAIPGLLLAIGIVAMLGPGLIQIMVAVGVTQIPIFARLLRGSILAARETDYVLAARSVGIRGRSILLSHILPNSLSPVIVGATLAMATAIIDVAGLGFLGLGPQDPSTPEWGTMLTDTTRYLQTAPFLALIPGAAIVVTVLGFNLIGDGMREALDPKFRGRA